MKDTIATPTNDPVLPTPTINIYDEEISPSISPWYTISTPTIDDSLAEDNEVILLHQPLTLPSSQTTANTLNNDSNVVTSNDITELHVAGAIQPVLEDGVIDTSMLPFVSHYRSVSVPPRLEDPGFDRPMYHHWTPSPPPVSVERDDHVIINMSDLLEKLPSVSSSHKEETHPAPPYNQFVEDTHLRSRVHQSVSVSLLPTHFTSKDTVVGGSSGGILKDVVALSRLAASGILTSFLHSFSYSMLVCLILLGIVLLFLASYFYGNTTA